MSGRFPRRARLAEDRCFLLPDRRGFGGSPNLDDGAVTSDADDADDVVKLRGAGAHLAGHSCGWTVAMLAARTALYERPVLAGRRRHRPAGRRELPWLVVADSERGGRLVTVPGVAHEPERDQPEELMSARCRLTSGCRRSPW